MNPRTRRQRRQARRLRRIVDADRYAREWAARQERETRALNAMPPIVKAASEALKRQWVQP